MMKNLLLVVAVTVAVLAGAGQAMGQVKAGGVSIAPTAWSNAGKGISDDAGNPLADYRAVEIALLNTTGGSGVGGQVTEADIKTLFAAGNVQGILNDLVPLCTTAIGFGGHIAPGVGTDYSLPGYFYGPFYQFLPDSPTVEAEVGKQVYMLAVNATSSATDNLTTANGISQMGMWTIKGPGNAATQWIMPAPNPILPSAIYPDPGTVSPAGQTYAPYDTVDSLDAVIGPGYQPCGQGWLAPFDAIWPGTSTVAGSYGVQLAPVRLPGDANADGKVDINDLTIVLAHYGRSGMRLVPGRVHGGRHGRHQRPDDRAGPLRSEPGGVGRRRGVGAGAGVSCSSGHRRRRIAGLPLAETALNRRKGDNP